MNNRQLPSLENLRNAVAKLRANLKHTTVQDSFYVIFDWIDHSSHGTELEKTEAAIGISLIIFDVIKTKLKEREQNPLFEVIKKELNIRDDHILDLPLSNKDSIPYLEAAQAYLQTMPKEMIKHTIWGNKENLSNNIQNIIDAVSSVGVNQSVYNSRLNLFPSTNNLSQDEANEEIGYRAGFLLK